VLIVLEEHRCGPGSLTEYKTINIFSIRPNFHKKKKGLRYYWVSERFL